MILPGRCERSSAGRRGELASPLGLWGRAGLIKANSNALSGVEEEFEVAFGAGEMAGFDAYSVEGERLGGGLDGGDGALM